MRPKKKASLSFCKSISMSTSVATRKSSARFQRCSGAECCSSDQSLVVEITGITPVAEVEGWRAGRIDDEGIKGDRSWA